MAQTCLDRLMQKYPDLSYWTLTSLQICRAGGRKNDFDGNRGIILYVVSGIEEKIVWRKTVFEEIIVFESEK